MSNNSSFVPCLFFFTFFMSSSLGLLESDFASHSVLNVQIPMCELHHPLRMWNLKIFIIVLSCFFLLLSLIVSFYFLIYNPVIYFFCSIFVFFCLLTFSVIFIFFQQSSVRYYVISDALSDGFAPSTQV